MKEWYSIKELIDLKLSDLPLSHQGILRKAKREGWKSRPRKGLGGGKEYHISSLPYENQKSLKTDNDECIEFKRIVFEIIRIIPQIEGFQIYQIMCLYFGSHKTPSLKTIEKWINGWKTEAFKLFFKIARK